MVLPTQSKLKKAAGVKASQFEEEAAQSIYDLQNSSDKLKAGLREVHITGAKEIAGAVLIYVPVPQLPIYQKLIKEKNLLEELEKKFSGKSVLVIADRKIKPKESRKSASKQPVPFSRTLTHVHEATLDDVVFPVDIVGKRIRIKSDGSRLIKVILNGENKPGQDKLAVYQNVYKALTAKEVHFDFSA